MKKSKLKFAGLFLIFFYSCTTEPQPISYGTDACHFCKMTIMDNKYGSELITSKGKVFKFDAVECMINYTIQNAEQTEKANLYVTNYEDPHDWILANNAVFLRSPNLPSPMGQFITSVKKMESAKEIQLEMGGEIQNFDEVIQSINKNQAGFK